ncbi:MAG: sulfotransferase [Frankiales bacterium]|nr:sulfotransferase [Frankiales bacterium]
MVPPGEATASRSHVAYRQRRPSQHEVRAGASAVLDGLWKLARGWVPDAHEGPGALVPREVWTSAVRRLADELLQPTGLPATGGLTSRQAETVELLGQMSPDASPPVAWDGHLAVVVGCGRSGTTWLERMLMSARAAGGVDGVESFAFEQGAPLWLHLDAMAPLVDRPRLVRALRDFYDTVFAEALAAHAPSARVFVEKTPMHSLLLPQLSAVYPDASYIHLVRDGRDVARSISQVGFFGIPDPADAARLWRRVLVSVRAAAPELGRFREVRYEDLLADPVEQVSDLLGWLGVDVDAEVHDELRRRAGSRVSMHAGTSQAVGTGTWRALPSWALAQVYAECGALLVGEGYATRRELRRVRRHPAYWRRAMARRG